MIDVQFVEDIIKENLTPTQAFQKNFPEECEGKEEKEIEILAKKRLKQKDNEKYYIATYEDIKSVELQEGEYTRDVAEKELLWIYTEAKKRAKASEKWNVATIQSLMQPLQELDKIKGLYEIKMKMQHSPIKIEGFEGLKIIDSNGNVIDGDFTEPPQLEDKGENE